MKKTGANINLKKIKICLKIEGKIKEHFFFFQKKAFSTKNNTKNIVTNLKQWHLKTHSIPQKNLIHRK